jgi:hypothetical protein
MPSRHASPLAEDLRQVISRSHVMKRYTSIAVCAGMLCATSFANAAGNQLAPVTVTGNTQALASCTPPDARPVCAAWHAEIRRNFSNYEIGELFGARTAYPNYSVSFDRLQVRYNALMGEFAATNAADLDAIASK